MASVTDVTANPVITVMRARVTPISRASVISVTAPPKSRPNARATAAFFSQRACSGLRRCSGGCRSHVFALYRRKHERSRTAVNQQIQ